jgi:hypothetical protein
MLRTPIKALLRAMREGGWQPTVRYWKLIEDMNIASAHARDDTKMQTERNHAELISSAA